MHLLDLTGNNNRICIEFFPNCSICSKFQTCFPTNGLNDELSEMALLNQMDNKTMKSRIMKRTYGN